MFILYVYIISYNIHNTVECYVVFLNIEQIFLSLKLQTIIFLVFKYKVHHWIIWIYIYIYQDVV
jgi:hypothetical protein